MKLCPSCLAEHIAWLDYRPPAPIKIAQSGSPRWNVPHGTRVNETIRNQHQLIRDYCTANHQTEQVR